MRTRIAARSEKEGFSSSRLPTFTAEEIKYIKGTHDFLGVNTYTTSLVEKISEPEYGEPSWEKDMGVRTWQDNSWETSDSDWLKVTI